MTTATTIITSNGGGTTASVSVAENTTAVADVDATAGLATILSTAARGNDTVYGITFS